MGGKHTLVTDVALDKLAEVRRFVESSARSLGVNETAVPDLVLAVDEAVTNIIVHGYKHQPGSVEVSIDADGTALIVRLRDKAPGFDPCSYPKLNLRSSLEKDTPGGFGLHLINKAVDDISYRIPHAGGNELTLVKQNVIPSR